MNKYSINHLLILLILLASFQLILFGDSFSHIISVFIISSSVIYWIRRNPFESIIGGTILTFIMDLVLNNCNHINCKHNMHIMHNNINEHFENMDLSSLESMISKLEKTAKEMPSKDPLDGIKDFNKRIDNSSDNSNKSNVKDGVKNNTKNSALETYDNLNSYTNNQDDLDDIIKTNNTKKSKIDEEEYINTLTADDILHLEKDEDDDEQYKKNPKPKTKNIDDYKPHEAQRETYRMINTVKQLKDTIDSLTPTIKSGQHILKMLEQFQL